MRGGGSLEIGRPWSRGWKNFGWGWTRGWGSWKLDNFHGRHIYIIPLWNKYKLEYSSNLRENSIVRGSRFCSSTNPRTNYSGWYGYFPEREWDTTAAQRSVMWQQSCLIITVLVEEFHLVSVSSISRNEWWKFWSYFADDLLAIINWKTEWRKI